MARSSDGVRNERIRRMSSDDIVVRMSYGGGPYGVGARRIRLEGWALRT